MTRPPPSLFRRKPSRGSPHRAVGAALVASALVLGGCSQVPDYANPVEWYKSAAGVFSGDSNENAKAEKPPPAPGADQPFPALGDVPERPSREAKLADLEKVAEGLAADRKNARYTSAPQKPTAVTTEPAPAPTTPAPPTPPPSPEPEAAAPPPPAPEAAPAPPAQIQSSVAAPAQASNPQASEAQAPVQVASRAPETTGPVDVQALFKRLFAESGPRAVAPPSSGKLPPLPSSPPAASAPSPPPAPAPTAAPMAPSGGQIARAELGAVRDLNEFQGAGSATTVRAAVIHFAVGSAALTAEAKRALRKVAKLHKERGGTVRVVGHASSRTREMPLEKHKLVNFEISLKRARAVAQELIRLGVKPEALFVGAVGDNDPVYYEWMPSGEAGNRRAEVYLDF